MRTALIGFMAGAIALAGCGNKEEKAHEEAVKAQKEADDKAVAATKAQKEADDKIAIAKHDSEAALAKDHADARDKLQKSADDATKKLEDLRGKVAKTTAAKRKAADAAVAEADARVTAIKAGMAKLPDATGDAWNAAKVQVEGDIAALGKATDAIDAAIK